MAPIPYFVALPIVRTEEGAWAAREPAEFPSAESARRRAMNLADTHGGAVAFSRTGDPALGEFGDAQILGRYGDLPADLVAGE